MSFGKNIQYLRQLSRDMTQEDLAEKLDVTRQTVSKWELDAAQPEMDKAVALCKLFNCTLDNLFREDMDKRVRAFTNLRVETLPAFRYVCHAVISSTPESDAIEHVRGIARKNGIEKPRVIGWDFPFVSPEQTNVYHMHGYAAAWVLPEGLTPEGAKVCEQPARKYAAIHIDTPFDNPFATIPNAYKTLMDYMRLNGLTHDESSAIPCFETDGDSMDIFIAAK